MSFPPPSYLPLFLFPDRHTHTLRHAHFKAALREPISTACSLVLFVNGIRTGEEQEEEEEEEERGRR